jgi:hypothetical protein
VTTIQAMLNPEGVAAAAWEFIVSSACAVRET